MTKINSVGCDTYHHGASLQDARLRAALPAGQGARAHTLAFSSFGNNGGCLRRGGPHRARGRIAPGAAPRPGPHGPAGLASRLDRPAAAGTRVDALRGDCGTRDARARARSLAWSLACLLACLLARLVSFARSLAWSLARLLARSLGCLFARLVAYLLACTIVCLLARSLARLVDRLLARSLARSLGRSSACLLARLRCCLRCWANHWGQGLQAPANRV